MLICACKEASEKQCNECPKYKKDKPDVTLNVPQWERKVDEEDEGSVSGDMPKL